MLKSLLRKLRGIVGTGLSWGFSWSFLGTALHWSLASLGFVGAPDMIVTATMYGLMGFYGGCVFGGVLSLTEHRRSLSELHLGRVAGWGALGGLFVPVVYHLLGGGAGLRWFSLLWTSPELWFTLAIIAPLGAASAAGMTAIARSGSDQAIGEGDGSPLSLHESGPTGALEP